MTHWSGQLRLTVWAWAATVLGSISLFPLFQSKRYILIGAVACAVVALTGAGLRALRTIAPLVVIGQAVTLSLFATAVYAHRHAYLGFIPSSRALHEVNQLWYDGVDAANKYAAPVPENAGLMFATVLGLAACAILVDALAVGLRRAPLAGLPLLAMYMIPVAVTNTGVPWLAFLPGAVGYVFLVAADERERLSHWGRQITHAGHLFAGSGEAQRVSTEALASSGRRIGLSAIALAVVVPALVPTFTAWTLPGTGNGPGNGHGDGLSVRNPLVDLRRDLERPEDLPVLTVHTDDPDPSYLRLAALESFDGREWQPRSNFAAGSQVVTGPLPLAPGLGADVPRTSHHYDFIVGRNFSSPWLPTFYTPESLAFSSGQWRVDPDTMTLFAARDGDSVAGLQYSVRGLDLSPTHDQLEAARSAPAGIFGNDTRLPANLPPVVSRLAHRITAKDTTDFDSAVALQNWFRSTGGFGYSLRSVNSNGNDLVRFLTRDRVGYCQQFAASMAIMARTLHIPARVAVGFLRPQQVAPHTYVYSTHDLHSWPELYFQGTGWVRFEPTPASRTGAAPTYTRRDTEGPVGTQPSQPVRTRNLFDTPTTPLHPGDISSSGGATNHSGEWVATGLAVLVVVLLLLSPGLARQYLRRSRRRIQQSAEATATAGWDELRDVCLDLGVSWDDTRSPRANGRLVRPFVNSDPDAVGALNRVVVSVERARYSRGLDNADRVPDDVRLLTAALSRTASRWRRFRAGWLPSSLAVNLRRRLSVPGSEDRPRGRGDDTVLVDQAI